jgi:diguanylate cyclase (GGDEF)-like protein
LGENPLKYKGRIITFFFVLCINSIYISHYFFRDGFVSVIEYVGLPVMLVMAWIFGKQYDKAKFYSENDTLTGIYNRRAIDACFAKAAAMTDGCGQKLAVFLIDVDNFKQVNDNFGHKEGDHLLKCLSNELVKSVRRTDIVARWGGDEFVILSPNITKRDNVLEIMQRINENLENISTSQMGVSVSIGVAMYPNEGRSFDDLLKSADKRMYNMKIKHLAQ